MPAYELISENLCFILQSFFLQLINIIIKNHGSENSALLSHLSPDDFVMLLGEIIQEYNPLSDLDHFFQNYLPLAYQI